MTAIFDAVFEMIYLILRYCWETGGRPKVTRSNKERPLLVSCSCWSQVNSPQLYSDD